MTRANCVSNFISYEKVDICPVINAAILLSKVNITDAALSRINYAEVFCQL